MPIIVENLFFTYMKGMPFAHTAVNDISFCVSDGEFVGLIGHTGCGKSTLIQAVAGLLKPDAGRVLLDGEDINAKDYERKKLRRRVGVVFQYPEYQLFEETVELDVAFGPKKAGLSPEEIRERVAWALSIVGMDVKEVGVLSPFELSGGQKRKVAIAGVLANKPGILILDEPIAGLDPAGRDSFMNFIRRLNGMGTTILMISHNMDGLAEYAGRILVMNESKIVLDGTPKEVFADIEKLKAMGLGASEPREVAHMLAQKGLDVPRDIIKFEDLKVYILKQVKGSC
jgi:energy-coupling factor transport system ATP-binding protein